MATPHGKIEHVSDTALMVAACRAYENSREFGLVQDPFAERLAGRRGIAIGRNLPRFETMCFGIGVRTHFIDEMILGLLAEKEIEVVLSVGAGLDARPWRLPLPAGLRWIEVDFPEMLGYKAAVMAGEKPACSLTQMPLDITDAAGRRALFGAAEGQRALMITEGLLMYLPGDAVNALAAEAAGTGGIAYWLLDVTSPAMSKMIRMDMFVDVQNVRAESHLDGDGVLEAVSRAGWRAHKQRTFVKNLMSIAPERLAALQRARIAANLPPPERPPEDDPSGVHLFRRD